MTEKDRKVLFVHYKGDKIFKCAIGGKNTPKMKTLFIDRVTDYKQISYSKRWIDEWCFAETRKDINGLYKNDIYKEMWAGWEIGRALFTAYTTKKGQIKWKIDKIEKTSGYPSNWKIGDVAWCRKI